MDKPSHSNKDNTHIHQKTDAEYFDEINPVTGLKYDIPFLSYSDDNYYDEYVRYMKLKETNPALFNKILMWD